MIFLRRTRNVASIVTLLLVFGACALAQSQPRQPQRSTESAQQPAAPDPRGTDALPLIVTVQPTAKTDAEAAEEQRQIQQQAEDRWWTRRLAITTALLGLFQLIAIGFQVGIAARQNRLFKSQNSIINDQSTIMAGQRTTNDAMLATNREIERAYITFGHKNLIVHGTPDAQGGRDRARPRGFTLTIMVTNAGRTPGDVLGGFIGFTIAPEPGPPDVTRGKASGFTVGFLLPRKSFLFTAQIQDDPEVLRQLAHGEGQDRLWLIGEVDYEDRFGQLHTCGYGRCMTPYAVSGVYEFNVQAALGPYNFDRPMNEDKRKHYGKNQKRHEAYS